MKKFLFLPLSLLMTLSFSSCSDNDNNDDNGNNSKPAVAGAFVLNQGNYTLKMEGSLTFFDYELNTAAQDVFANANGRSIGATPQAAIEYKGKIFVAVYESNTLEILNADDFSSIKQISFADKEGQFPRSLVAKDDKVYISMYNGYVSRLDVPSLSIDKTVQVGPNPEIMAIRGNNLYVPNSDGMNWQVGYGTTASKINLASFSVEKTFTVGLNPTKFVSNGSDLFLLCMGNYYDVNATVYRVDDNDKSVAVAEATLLDIAGNSLYLINAPYWLTDFDYSVYDITSGTTSPMLSDKGVDSPAAVAVDAKNGKIIITSYNLENGYASYTTPGYANVYSLDGKLINTFDTGVAPVAVFFN